MIEKICATILVTSFLAMFLLAWSSAALADKIVEMGTTDTCSVAYRVCDEYEQDRCTDWMIVPEEFESCDEANLFIKEFKKELQKKFPPKPTGIYV